MSAATVIPNPDPSEITTRAIDRSVLGSEKLMTIRVDGIEKAIEVFQADLTRVPTSVDRAIAGLRELIEARLSGMDKDVDLVHASLLRREPDIKIQVDHLRALIMSELEQISKVSFERFARIDTQFIERDKRTDQLSLADKTAVAAALQAAKEAVGAQNTSNSIAIAKSESSTVESIRQLQTLFNSAIAAVNDKLNDVRSRIDRGDGNTSGQNSANVGHREDRTDNRSLIFSLISTGLAFSALLVTAIFHFK